MRFFFRPTQYLEKKGCNIKGARAQKIRFKSTYLKLKLR